MNTFAYLNDFADDAQLVHRRADTAIKLLGEPGSGRVGGYLVVWGSPEQRDLQGEYFTPDTDLALDWYERRPALYHHGLDGELKTIAIGVIDRLKADQTGLWAEAQLDMRKRYVNTIQSLIDRGILAWSSGSLPHLVEMAADGRIKRWPIVEGSLTPAPAEPRHTDIRSIKSALAELPAPPAEESSTEEPTANKDAGALPDLTTPTTPTEVKMDPREMLLGLLAQLLASKPEWQLTPEEQSAMVDQVLAQMQAADAATMSAPITPEALPAVAGKAAAFVFNAANTFFTNRAQQAVATQNALKAAMNGQLAIAPPPAGAGASGFTGNGGNAGQQGNGQNGGDPEATNHRIEVRAKFAGVDAQDMSFMAFMDRFNRHANKTELKPFISNEDYPYFVRELAEKAGKAVETGQLSVGKDAIKSINFLKANELSHSTQANFGDEWVPTLWSDQVWNRARLDNVILPLFKSIEMPSNPFEIPIEGTDPTVYFVPETTNEDQQNIDTATNPIPDSKVGSGKVTLSAKKLALRVGFSAELVEDSTVPILSIYREQAQRAIMDAIDHVLLNGDDTNAGTGNINSDDADPADTEKYLAFNGLLHSPLVEDTTRRIDAGGAAPTLASIRAMRFKMPAQYAQKPNQIAYLVGGEVYAKLINFNEFLTLDKYGPNATILNGEIGKIDGSPVLTSAEFGLAEADGKRSATPGLNTLGRMLAVYKPNWWVGYRRRVAVDVTYLPYHDSYQLTATVRLAFVHFDDDSASALYNLAV